MKYAYLFLIALSTICLFGQAPKYDVKPNPIYTYFISDMTSHVGHGALKNNSKTTIHLLWTKENVIMPEKWTSSVCDCNQCWSENLDKCIVNYTNNIFPNDTCILDVHVTDDGNEGVAHVIIWVYEIEDSTVKYRADYYFNKLLSNNEIRNIEIMVYPNPASNSFAVESNQYLNRIELYSILGEKITSYKVRPHGNYDLSTLQDGLYFVKLIGANNHNLKTIRIQKRAEQ